jgi:hypothetical protein
MKDIKQLQSLDGFTGTSTYYPAYPGFYLTDGTKALAEAGECYWLFDIIWSYQPKCLKDSMLRQLQFWTLKVKPEQERAKPMTLGAVLESKRGPQSMATVICERDTGNVAFKQEIPFTDFPIKPFEVKVWVAPTSLDGSKTVQIAYLPSEH